MVKIELENNKGYPWINYNGIHCKGYAFDEDTVIENIELAKKFEGMDKIQVLEFAEKLNGFFAVVIEYSDEVMALVDHMRSFPLFYYKDGGNVVICDQITKERMRTFSIDKNAEKQINSSLYILGKKTLFKDVFGVEAGTYLLANNNGTCYGDAYYTFKYCDEQIKDINTALEKMSTVYENSFKRLIKYLNGRTAVVPLSGGHDSRLVAFYLKKLGYKNIIAFSYGDPSMSDSVISKQAAKALDIKYYYIPYTRLNIRKAYKKYYEDYMVYSANGVSVPRLQTWYAVHWLFENKVIDEKCVFCPGYGGVLPGHYINSAFVDNEYIKKDDLIKLFEKEFFASMYRLAPDYYEKYMAEFKEYPDIKALPENVPTKRAAEIFEQWVYKEDQTKGIQNAARLYEFYGIKWATPFFEKPQFDFWAAIDNSLRYKNKAFKEMEKKLLEGPITDVPFTGSKEQILKKKKLSFVEKCFHMADICLHPRKNHYMNVIVPIHTHIYNTVVKRTSSPFYFVKCEYIKFISKNTK